MFRDRRRLRRWAAQVLLVWLFGIATGIAHACAVRTADLNPGSGEPGANHVVVVSHEHGGSVDEADAQVNCLDFCEKSSVTLPTLKSKLDPGPDLHLPAAAPSPAAAWVAALPLAELVRPDGVIDQRGGPPLRIALQRLAL